MSMLIHLYQNDGKCPYDMAEIEGICNCRRGFERVWKRIERKFVIKNGVVSHKIVTKKLRVIKKMMQAKRRAGLKGAAVTWQNHSSAIPSAMATNNQQPTTQNQQIVSIGIGKELSSEEMLVLDCRVKEKMDFLSEHVGRLFMPGARSKRTLAKMIEFMVARIQADPQLECWLTDAVEWATVAHRAGRQSRGVKLFVSKLKQETGYGSAPRLLK